MPLTEDELDLIFKEAEEEKIQRVKDLPTEKEALKVLNQAYCRLKDLGFTDFRFSNYKTNDNFEAIELGSLKPIKAFVAINGVWSFEAGDMWSIRPILVRKNSES